MKKILQTLVHKKHILVSSFVFSFAVILLVASFRQVAASFGSWGDSSLIHACKNSRGGIALVGTSDSCNANETEVTWLKDVDAGSGLSISRSSSGVTLSVDSAANTSGWTDAGESWTYASADSPTFTFTISGDKTGKYSAGMRIKLTQTTVKYFLITGVSYSSPNTTVTIYGGTDYSLTNASITSPYFSIVKAPLGFPLDPVKWTEETVHTTNSNQGSPSSNTWYNIGSISLVVPVGAWKLSYSASYGYDFTAATYCYAYVTLSTSNNSESNVNWTEMFSNSGTVISMNHGYHEEFVNLTSKTTYYLNVKTAVAGLNFLYSGSSTNPTIVRATSSYL